MPPSTPLHDIYDVVIIGGAIHGSSIAWWLTRDKEFDGKVLVVERDPSYEFASSSLSNSCIRQQYSNPTNIAISQFGAEFVKNLRHYMGGDERVPQLEIQNFGYLYLASKEAGMDRLKEAQKIQADHGAGTKTLNVEEIRQRFPYFNLEDISGGNFNTVDEGYFDGNAVFEWLRRKARENGAEYIKNEAVGLVVSPSGDTVSHVKLASGEEISCGTVVNAAGPRAARVAAMANIKLPVEPRKRYTYIFSCEKPLGADLPLTIDPGGMHVRREGQYFMAGMKPENDGRVDPTDFEMDHSMFEERVWPALAHRIPAFEAIRVIRSWIGHYDYNFFDYNGIVGPHREISNFLFSNGYSGHGLQQAPAVGRAIAEFIRFGEYRSLDLTPFCHDRIEQNKPSLELAII